MLAWDADTPPRRLVGMHLPKAAVGDLLAELQAQELAIQQAQQTQQAQWLQQVSMY